MSKGELTDSAIVAILKPFVNASAITRDGRVRLQLRMFFENIIKQTDVALQYEEKFQAWKEVRLNLSASSLSLLPRSLGSICFWLSCVSCLVPMSPANLNLI